MRERAAARMALMGTGLDLTAEESFESLTARERFNQHSDAEAAKEALVKYANKFFAQISFSNKLFWVTNQHPSQTS